MIKWNYVEPNVHLMLLRLSLMSDLNQQPIHYKWIALPIELMRRKHHFNYAVNLSLYNVTYRGIEPANSQKYYVATYFCDKNPILHPFHFLESFATYPYLFLTQDLPVICGEWRIRTSEPNFIGWLVSNELISTTHPTLHYCIKTWRWMESNH